MKGTRSFSILPSHLSDRTSSITFTHPILSMSQGQDGFTINKEQFHYVSHEAENLYVAG